MSAAFGDRLAKAMAERGPLCVGIDPHPNLLEQWGLEDSATGLAAFTEAVYEGCAPFAYPLCEPVLSQFLGTPACIILPPLARADASLLTSVVGECACSLRCVRGSTFDSANTPLCYRGTP